MSSHIHEIEPDVFHAEYGRLIHATVWKVMQRRHAHSVSHDDVVNTVYAKLLDDDSRRIRAWRGDSKFSTYLTQVVRNLTLDCLRKEARLMDKMDDLEKLNLALHHTGDGESDETIRTELHNAMHSAIEDLPPKRAMIMQLRLKGKTLREIADIMGLPKGTVFAENTRAMKALRPVLEQARAALEEE